MYWLLLNTCSMIILLLLLFYGHGKVSSDALFGIVQHHHHHLHKRTEMKIFRINMIWRLSKGTVKLSHSTGYSSANCVLSHQNEILSKWLILCLLGFTNNTDLSQWILWIVVTSWKTWGLSHLKTEESGLTRWFNPAALHLLLRYSFHSSPWPLPSCSNNPRCPQNPFQFCAKSRKWTSMDRTNTLMRPETESKPRSRDPWRILLPIRTLWWE